MVLPSGGINRFVFHPISPFPFGFCMLQLITYPHPTLRFASQPIVRVDAALREMVEQMFEIMYENRGVGLAANQVNLPLRMFIANPTGEKESGEELVFLNPVIRKSNGSAESDEGCLSLPGIHAPVKRNKFVHVKAYSITGQEIDLHADGFLARIIQHEIDHLDGVLFIDRVAPETQRVILDELNGFVSTHESKQKHGLIPSDQVLSEQREDWLVRYCR